MLKNQRELDEEAIGWVIRLKQGTAEDWEAFTFWLEADESHPRAYEAAALADADAGELAPEPAVRSMSTGEPAPIRTQPRRLVLGWAVAAGVALAVGWFSIAGSGQPYSVETGSGERQTIALDDGSRIELNGGTRLRLDRDRPRYAALERGEALFRVVHDPRRPFEVETGGAVLQDLGTVFNVVRGEGSLDVAVSEGAILFEPEGEKKDLRPGMALSRRDGGVATVTRVDKAAVGAWRDGRLVYSAAPLARIAADLSRNLGLKVRVGQGTSAPPFSGVIMLDGNAEQVIGRACALLGLSAQRSGEGWIMKSGASAGR